MEEEKVVHALQHGRPLCRFSESLPKDWPPGHTFVFPDELKKITCEKCLVKAKELKR